LRKPYSHRGYLAVEFSLDLGNDLEEREKRGGAAMRVGRGATRVAVSHIDSVARAAAATVREASAADAGAVVRFLRVFADHLATSSAAGNTISPNRPVRAARQGAKSQ
jgi:hypothetical protein